MCAQFTHWMCQLPHSKHWRAIWRSTSGWLRGASQVPWKCGEKTAPLGPKKEEIQDGELLFFVWWYRHPRLFSPHGLIETYQFLTWFCPNFPHVLADFAADPLVTILLRVFGMPRSVPVWRTVNCFFLWLIRQYIYNILRIYTYVCIYMYNIHVCMYIYIYTYNCICILYICAYTVYSV
jgi:hypothetical protein